MGKRGRKKEHHGKRIKLGYLIPTYNREMIVKIAEKTGKTATDALIDMINERHIKVFGEKGE